MAHSYIVERLSGAAPIERASTLINPHRSKSTRHYQIDPLIEKLHRSLPDYAETRLHSLPLVAEELGFAHVFVKDESTRFGLPSFKITGASWAVFKALCKHVELPTDVLLDHLRQALAQTQAVRVVTCTAGNWGRAVARMARVLNVRATVFVPRYTQQYTRDLIASEGADLRYLDNADYDAALLATRAESEQSGTLLVLDMTLDNFYDIPQWVTDGYSTILQETDRQVASLTAGGKPDLVTCSVGAGSWAQAVAAHYKHQTPPATLISVEPDRAASLKEALHEGEVVQIKTSNTIMNGMNCGTISSVAWPILKDGVDIATVVTELEAHQSAQELRASGIDAGPCGAANLAALRRICREANIANRQDMIVVLFSSEGMREYDAPVEDS